MILSKFWTSVYRANVNFGRHGTLWWFCFSKAIDLRELTEFFNTLEAIIHILFPIQFCIRFLQFDNVSDELCFCIQSFVISYSYCTKRHPRKFSMCAIYFSFCLWILYMLKFGDASLFSICKGFALQIFPFCC